MKQIIQLKELSTIARVFETLRCQTIFVCDDDNKYVGYIKFRDFINKKDFISRDNIAYYDEVEFNKSDKPIKVLLNLEHRVIAIFDSSENEFQSTDIIRKIQSIENHKCFVEIIKLPPLCKSIYIFSHDENTATLCKTLNKYQKIKWIAANYSASVPVGSCVAFDTINDMLLFLKKAGRDNYCYCLLKNLFQTYENYSCYTKEYPKMLQTMKKIGVEVFWVGFPSRHFYDKKDTNSVFFEDLKNNYPLDYESYIKQKQLRHVFFNGMINQVKDARSTCYNVIGGRRYTVGANCNNNRNIFCFGPCFVFGIYNSDSTTICSVMQKKINECNYPFNVINCGLEGGYDLRENIKALMLSEVKTGDIAIFFNEDIEQIKMDLKERFITLDLLKRLNNKSNWYYDRFEHCLPSVNLMIADNIIKYPYFVSVVTKTISEEIKFLNNEFVYESSIELNRYIQEIRAHRINDPNCVIGAIEMNANPMTRGHSYLIQKALEQVDFLYVFLLTQEKTEIPLQLRKKILQAEVSKYPNVQLLECGRIWGNRLTFPEYFEKEENNEIVINAEKEILIFAKYIANALNIKKRFVGTEPNDKVTDQFNRQLKQTLNRYGIDLVEIPRLSVEGVYIQAGNVRSLIRERNFQALDKMMTPEAIDILKNEYL